jgi:hypothetical protein
MSKLLHLGAILLVAVLATGCTISGPRYTTNYSAVESLKGANLAPVKVGAIKSSDKKVESLTIRGSTYKSPYGSFTEYFRAALLDELDHANLLDDKSGTEIQGTLLRNELNGAGVSTGFAEIEARLAVHRDGSVVYERTKIGREEWPSSFIGGVAIPRAAQNYPLAIRKVLNEFYSDPEFIAALQKK